MWSFTLTILQNSIALASHILTKPCTKTLPSKSTPYVIYTKSCTRKSMITFFLENSSRNNNTAKSKSKLKIIVLNNIRQSRSGSKYQTTLILSIFTLILRLFSLALSFSLFLVQKLHLKCFFVWQWLHSNIHKYFPTTLIVIIPTIH